MRTVIGWGLLVVMAPCPLRMLVAQEHTTVGGYGEVHYTNPTGPKTPPVVNLARFVVYVAHGFDERLAFRSELEVEDAKIEGGQAGGEVLLVQEPKRTRLNSSNGQISYAVFCFKKKNN